MMIFPFPYWKATTPFWRPYEWPACGSRPQVGKLWSKASSDEEAVYRVGADQPCYVIAVMHMESKPGLRAVTVDLKEAGLVFHFS